MACGVIGFVHTARRQHLYSMVKKGQLLKSLRIKFNQKTTWFGRIFRKDDSAGNKKEEVNRRTGGKTILKNAHGWTLPAQQGQLKVGKDGCCCCCIVVLRPR